MKTTFLRATVLAGLALAASGALADGTKGEVTKVDTRRERVTIKHGPLENLDMPAMTMVFEVADPAMMDMLTVGSTITFTADRIDGKLTITGIE